MKLSLLIISLFAGVFLLIGLDKVSSEEEVVSKKEKMAKIIFHYEDSFSKEEKEKVESWLNQTASATQRTLGTYPFDLHFYLHRSNNSKEPVPWANTQRSSKQGVHFHVNTDFPIEDFLSDWTAPHEISHLAIPFLGKSNSWFAEGFATYMQNEILLEMEECTQEDINKKFKTKLDMARPYYQKDEPYAEVAMSLRKTYHFPEMYWGGAFFFIQLNNNIKAIDGRTLGEVLKDYQICCRLEDDDLESLLNSIDQLVEGKPASDLMDKYKTLPAKEIFK